ncbi:MAG: hypothetical protein IT364_19655 [Candidatus Hydrogenedentes bacterium]|nr:hypothetical protein [Candidatus Hydrogenedentota bacterium]
MSSSDTLVKHAVIDGYREELRGRYALENVRRFSQFDGISDEKLETLRDYLLECVYPAAAERHRLDVAFEHVGQILHSPRQMAPLMKMAVAAAWKLGLGFTSAMAVGTHVIEVHRETRRLEESMCEFARVHQSTPETMARRESIVRMLAQVPEQEMLRFRKDVLKLFESLSNVKLLAAAVSIMENAKNLMESRPDLYGPEEVAGFQLGHDVLRRGLALFQRLRPQEFAALIGGIEAVEIDWYDGIKAEAAAS